MGIQRDQLEMKPYVETDAQYEKRKMNLLELDKQIKEHKIIENLKDGIADGLLHGERDDNKTHYYYKIGYDYGCTMFDMLGTNICRTRIKDGTEND
tara:strand:+ start:182 stop:469 length:288 start_codon:yes stop_codon:yes gene_type:complete